MHLYNNNTAHVDSRNTTNGGAVHTAHYEQGKVIKCHRAIMQSGWEGQGMLRAAPKGCAHWTMILAREEDRLLRDAFGRHGGHADARAAAASVIARYQQMGGGMWFLCNCRPESDRCPVLVPVAQTHIRRHEDTHWPAHHEDCEFFRDPSEQAVAARSYGRAQAGAFRLARAFGKASTPPEKTIVGRTGSSGRPRLARLLMRLVDGAGLQWLGAGERIPMLVDQIKAIWRAARNVEIDQGVRLSEFLCTSPGRLEELVEKVTAAPAGQFKETRPHGVLIARIGAFSAGVLEPLAGEPLAVSGRIAVFGEGVGAIRESPAARAGRAPYLGACVVGRSAENGAVEILSAYLHPCASPTHLMLLDSDYERQTLAQLRSLQAWIDAKRRVSMTIEKPVFDLLDRGNEVEVAAGKGPCIPDFIVRAKGGGAGGCQTAIVETMGYSDETYWEGKVRMHKTMSAALAGAPVVLHDLSTGASGEVDREFWRGLMRLIAGRRAEDSAAPQPRALPAP